MTAPTTEEGGTGTIMAITVGGEGCARIAWGLRSHGFVILSHMGSPAVHGRAEWPLLHGVHGVTLHGGASAWGLWAAYEPDAWLPHPHGCIQSWREGAEH